MMRRPHDLLASSLCALSVGLLPVSAQPAQQVPPCTEPVTVAEQSFQRLGGPTRHAYVWVDDIPVRWFGRYGPFDVFVLVGNAFPPFEAASGRLTRPAFDRIARAAYNTNRFGPLRVDSARVRAGRTTLGFTSSRRRFTLKVLSVQTRSRTGASAELQVCW